MEREEVMVVVEVGRGVKKKRSPGGDRKRERMNFGKQKRDHAETESQRRAEKKVNGDTG